MELGPERLAIATAVLETVRREIDQEEFRARLGVESGEADALLDDLREQQIRNEATPDLRWLTEDQLLLLNNALNEAANGLPPDRVSPLLRSVRAAALLAEVGRLLDAAAGHRGSRAVGVPYVDHLR